MFRIASEQMNVAVIVRSEMITLLGVNMNNKPLAKILNRRMIVLQGLRGLLLLSLRTSLP